MDTPQKTYSLAEQIAKRLNAHGYVTYFAGGWVRDHLLGHDSSDIDIATSATPEQVMALFERCIPVGVSFGVVLVVLEDHHFEVATFRSDGAYINGRKPESVHYGCAEEDASRRDFTMNGMFYDPATKQVLDFVGGRADLEAGLIRAIGDATERFREDKLRMIRAVRLAARFQFQIEEATKKGISEHASWLYHAVAGERIWHEFQKMSAKPGFERAICDCKSLGLLDIIFPMLASVTEAEIKKRTAGIERVKVFSPVAYLAELFAGHTQAELEEAFLPLKLSLKEQHYIELICRLSLLHVGLDVENGERVSDLAWVRFYCDEQSETALALFARRQPNPEAFLRYHHARQMELSRFIELKKAGRTVLVAKDLMAEGIKPGPQMGQLLHLAEKISVEQRICDAALLMRLLKISDEWPK